MLQETYCETTFRNDLSALKAWLRAAVRSETVVSKLRRVMDASESVIEKPSSVLRNRGARDQNAPTDSDGCYVGDGLDNGKSVLTL